MHHLQLNVTRETGKVNPERSTQQNYGSFSLPQYKISKILSPITLYHQLSLSSDPNERTDLLQFITKRKLFLFLIVEEGGGGCCDESGIADVQRTRMVDHARFQCLCPGFVHIVFPGNNTNNKVENFCYFSCVYWAHRKHGLTTLSHAAIT